jgi:hypothetical protein
MVGEQVGLIHQPTGQNEKGERDQDPLTPALS